MSAAMALFLTDLDSRARVKGSRDPLGLVPIWSALGRTVIGNLTTQSGSVRGFTTLLLGLYFAEQIHEREEGATDSTVDAFIRFEQMAGYCRVHHNGNEEHDVRGIDRIRRNIDESTNVLLSARQGEQILANQRIYGLWGLYRMPALSSGLLDPDAVRLSPVARQFVEEQYLSRLSNGTGRGAEAILRLLRETRVEFQLQGRHKEMGKALADLLRRRYGRPEAEFYHHYLVHGGDSGDPAVLARQRQLVDLLSDLPRGGFGFEALRQIIKEARQRGSDTADLHEHLVRIERLETLIVPAQRLFLFVLARDGQRLGDVAAEVERRWGQGLRQIHPEALRPLEAHIARASGSEGSGARWMAIADALQTGRFESAIRLLMEENGSVMKRRGAGAAWVQIEKGRIQVRFRDETSELPSATQLAHLWSSGYFINSLKSVIDELRRHS